MSGIVNLQHFTVTKAIFASFSYSSQEFRLLQISIGYPLLAPRGQRGNCLETASGVSKVAQWTINDVYSESLTIIKWPKGIYNNHHNITNARLMDQRKEFQSRRERDVGQTKTLGS